MDSKEIQLLLWFFAFLCAQVRKLNGDAISSCIPMERNALLGFKEGLKDPTNRLSSWVGDDCCTWEGVACDNRTGHVVKLDLRNPHPVSYTDVIPYNKWSLGGELRPSLLGLKQLNYLDLSMNNFGGIRIPEFMGSFRQLKYLNLSYAGLRGLVPHQLGNLSSLQYLVIQNDLDPFGLAIDNALWISRLSSLRYLHMWSVQFREGSQWLQALNMLPSIVEVRLRTCGITFPLALPHVNFTSLFLLDLSANAINSTIPAWLFNITSLECLDLTFNYIWGDIPPAIKNLASLKFLDLSLNPFLESKTPAAFGTLCKLQHLGLSGVNISKNLHELDKVFTFCIKNSLETLDMSFTQLSGYLPDWLRDFRMLKSLQMIGNSISGPIPASLGRLSALQELDISYNKLSGTIPGSLGSLSALERLDLSYNDLDGIVPESLGSLAELVSLELRSNFLEGVVSEEHFANLTKLHHLDLSENKFILNLGPGWIPPFQLWVLHVGYCRLGPRFPAWLEIQKNITTLDMSSTGILDTVPDWFWRSFSHINYLDISRNGITGSVPDLTSFISLEYFDLSSNYFHGPLPNFSSSNMMLVDLSNNSFSGAIHPSYSKLMPYLAYLSLSANNLSAEIPPSFCELGCELIDLSKNFLLGELPDCWNSSSIFIMDFSSNGLSGSVPPSICSLPLLESLHLSNNNLSGELPLSLRGCMSLNILDLGQNGFTGTIPTWIGENLLSLKILRLRSNKFAGNIPPNLSRLGALQILDLAGNSLSGTIPSSFGNFTAMKVLRETSGTILNDIIVFTRDAYDDKLQVTIKGIDLEYATLLPLVIAVDLSNNNLFGTIPEELTSLSGLISLNLSGNHLNGEITKKIGALQQLESLDLSRNNLSGVIPSSMISLTFLSRLNLSYNNLSGRVPTGNQLQTFTDPSIYLGNPGLCGFPLTQKCKDDETNQSPNAVGGDEQNDNAMDEGSEMKWLYLSMGPGFAVGFWAIFGPILFNRKWREAYFRLLDQAYDMIYVALAAVFNRFK